MRKAYILLADGFECVEALAPIDVMHRAGVDLKRVAVGHRLDVISSHGLMTLRCDMLLGDALLEDGDVLILPGGNPGYINLRESEDVLRVVRSYFDRGALVAAICGAPTVLAAAGVARGRRVTCHTSVISDMGDYLYEGGRVVEDSNLITAAGAGISIDFALAIAARIVSAETLSRVRQGMEV
ncbi:MAG: DJ-1/PfpI family protein [Alistipes sp.]|nr:DJ-1/PfpI family protein [Alistipes sp.]